MLFNLRSFPKPERPSRAEDIHSPSQTKRNKEASWRDQKNRSSTCSKSNKFVFCNNGFSQYKKTFRPLENKTQRNTHVMLDFPRLHSDMYKNKKGLSMPFSTDLYLEFCRYEIASCNVHPHSKPPFLTPFLQILP